MSMKYLLAGLAAFAFCAGLYAGPPAGGPPPPPPDGVDGPPPPPSREQRGFGPAVWRAFSRLT